MKIKFIIIFILIFLTTHLTFANANSMNWNNLTKEKIELKLPLLLIKGSKGFLACGYVNVETCNKTGEACAIVSGVKTHDDMLTAQIKMLSNEAEKIGIKVGMLGHEALDIFR